MSLITSDEESHEGGSHVGYTRCHCSDERNVWVPFEFGKLCVVVLKDTKGDGKAWASIGISEICGGTCKRNAHPKVKLRT